MESSKDTKTLLAYRPRVAPSAQQFKDPTSRGRNIAREETFQFFSLYFLVPTCETTTHLSHRFRSFHSNIYTPSLPRSLLFCFFSQLLHYFFLPLAKLLPRHPEFCAIQTVHERHHLILARQIAVVLLLNLNSALYQLQLFHLCVLLVSFLFCCIRSLPFLLSGQFLSSTACFALTATC